MTSTTIVLTVLCVPIYEKFGTIPGLGADMSRIGTVSGANGYRARLFALIEQGDGDAGIDALHVGPALGEGCAEKCFCLG